MSARKAGEEWERFLINLNFWDDTADIRCQTCGWSADIDDLTTLAELNQRADEHAEVCR